MAMAERKHIATAIYSLHCIARLRIFSLYRKLIMKSLVFILLLALASLNQVQAANFGATPHSNSTTPNHQSPSVSHHQGKTKHFKRLLKHKTHKHLNRLQNAPTEQAADKEFVWALIAFIGISLAIIALIVLGIIFNLVWLWIIGGVLALAWLTLIIIIIHMFSHWRLF